MQIHMVSSLSILGIGHGPTTPASLAKGAESQVPSQSLTSLKLPFTSKFTHSRELLPLLKALFEVANLYNQPTSAHQWMNG